jgi:hypothetical protein
LRPFTFFPRVEACGATDVGRLDALAVDYSGGGFWTPPLLNSNEPSEVAVYHVQRPSAGPSPIVLVDRRPGRKVVRKQSPSCSSTRTVPNRIHDLPRVVLRLLEIRKPDGDRNHVGDNRPLVVGQVGRVAAAGWSFFDCHGPPRPRFAAHGQISCGTPSESVGAPLDLAGRRRWLSRWRRDHDPEALSRTTSSRLDWRRIG